MIQPIQVVQGDYGYQIPFTLQDGNGNPVNLTGLTLTLNVQSAQDATKTLITLSGSMAIDNATSGTCHYTVASGDFPNAGTYLATVVTTSAGVSITYPGITIIVTPSLPKTIN